MKFQEAEAILQKNKNVLIKLDDEAKERLRQKIKESRSKADLKPIFYIQKPFS